MSNQSELYDIIVGAETGLLKGIKVLENSSSWQNITTVDKVNKEKEITKLCWGDDLQSQICVGRRDRSVDLYSRISGDIVTTYQDTGGEGTLKGIAKWDSRFVTCTDKGQLKVLEGQQEKLSLDVGGDIYCMKQNPAQKNLVVTGGKENDMKIWDLERPDEPVFKAKNVKNDWLNLRVPIMVTDVGFLADSNKIVTCTGHHQVRVYDPSSSMRRPVLDLEVDEYPLTCMSIRSTHSQVVVGNTQGLMALVDLRGKGHIVQKYKGFAGGIRGVHCHPAQDIIVSCGLDRFVRIHDINNRQLLSKFYMKSRLNCLLVADTWNSQSEQSEIQTGQSEDVSMDSQGDELDENDEEAIWANMSLVKEKNKNVTISASDYEQKIQETVKEESDTGSEEDEAEITGCSKTNKKRTKPQRHKGKKSKAKIQ